MLKRFWIIGLICVPLLMSGLRLIENPQLTQLRLFWFDSLMRYFPREKPENSPFAIAAIDEASLKEIGQWPWPRNKAADLITSIFEAGAAMVVMNINFAHPDRFSPDEIRSVFGPEVDKLSLINPDALLAQSMEKGPVILGSFRSVEDAGPKDPGASVISKFAPGYVSLGVEPKDFVPVFSDFLDPLDELIAASHSIGSVTVANDKDGILRRIPLIVAANNRLDGEAELRFFLALEAIRVALGQSQYLIEGVSGETNLTSEFQGLRKLKLGKVDLPLSRSGEFLIYESEDLGAEVISASKIIARQNPKIDGKIVFVGLRTLGAGDRATGPLGELRRSVDMQVMVAEQLIAGDYPLTPYGARWLEAGLIWITCLLCLACVFGFRGVLGFRLSLGLLSLLSPWVLSLVVFTKPLWAASEGQGANIYYLLDPTAPGAAGFLTLLFGFAGQMWFAEKAREVLRRQFARYLSPVVVETLTKTQNSDVFLPKTTEITVMFVDVRGFTTLSETLNASETIELVNKFLSVISDVVFSHEGTVDKYLGDGVMAFWNAPLPQPNHRDMAYRAGLDILKEIQKLNAALHEDPSWAKLLGDTELRVGIGLHTGAASVGNFGSDQRVDYSCVGDTVNTAARIESQCKTYQAAFLISEAAKPYDAGLLFVAEASLAGRTQKVKLFRPEKENLTQRLC